MGQDEQVGEVAVGVRSLHLCLQGFYPAQRMRVDERSDLIVGKHAGDDIGAIFFALGGLADFHLARRLSHIQRPGAAPAHLGETEQLEPQMVLVLVGGAGHLKAERA